MNPLHCFIVTRISFKYDSLELQNQDLLPFLYLKSDLEFHKLPCYYFSSSKIKYLGLHSTLINYFLISVLIYHLNLWKMKMLMRQHYCFTGLTFFIIPHFAYKMINCQRALQAFPSSFENNIDF